MYNATSLKQSAKHMRRTERKENFWKCLLNSLMPAENEILCMEPLRYRRISRVATQNKPTSSRLQPQNREQEKRELFTKLGSLPFIIRAITNPSVLRQTDWWSMRGVRCPGKIHFNYLSYIVVSSDESSLRDHAPTFMISTQSMSRYSSSDLLIQRRCKWTRIAKSQFFTQF